MLRKLRKRTAQSTLEYAVLAVIIIAALIAMKSFLQQSLQGKFKSSGDDISAEKFDPTSTIYNKTTVTGGLTSEVVATGVTTSTLQGDGDSTITNVMSRTEE